MPQLENTTIDGRTGMQSWHSNDADNTNESTSSRPVAILTASTRGIGLASARHLCEAGYHSVISSRSEENVKSALKTLHSSGYSASGLVCHATDNVGRRALLKHAMSIGPIHALIICAGTSPSIGMALDTTSQAADKMWKVNIQSMLDMVRDARDIGALNRDTTIVLLGSIGGYSALPNLGVYSVTKTAVHALVRVLAEELTPTRVVGVAPGPIRTDFLRPLWQDPQKERRMLRHIPLRRLGTPDDIGAVVAFLCSKGAAYITGETIVVAGGMRSRL